MQHSSQPRVDLLLVRPPKDRPKEYYDLHESLGIAYIASYLRQAGYRIELLDGTVEDYSSEQIVDHVLKTNPLSIGFTILMDGYKDAIRIIRALRSCGYPGHITLGQHFATFNAYRILEANPEIDSVVAFEGEKTASLLISHLRAGQGLSGIPGLVYQQSGTGRVIQTRPAELISCLDKLPFPARDVLLRNRSKFHSICISGSRGCAYRCKYCSISAFYRIPHGKTWRSRSTGNIVKEVETLMMATGIRRFTFVDDNFLGTGEVGRSHAQGIARELISKRLSIEFGIEARSDSVDEQTFRLLRKAGLTRVFLGVESGYQPTLNYFNKDSTVECNIRAIDLLQKLGIKIQMGFIMFHEHSTLDEIQANLEFLDRVKTFDVTAFFGDLEIRSGTAFFEEMSAGDVDVNYMKHYCIQDKRTKSYRELVQEILLALYRPLFDIKNARYFEWLPEEILERFEIDVAQRSYDVAKKMLTRFQRGERIAKAVVVAEKEQIKEHACLLCSCINACRIILNRKGVKQHDQRRDEKQTDEVGGQGFGGRETCKASF